MDNEIENKNTPLPGADGFKAGKKIIILAAVLAVLLVVAAAIFMAYFWRPKNAKNEFGKGEAETITKDAIKGTLPSLSNNPLENKPNLNPAEQSNPITEVKTNPFE